jgi:hypothetical protein
VALRTIDESNNPSSWRYYGPQTSTCGGGGCYPNCEARATDTGGRREAASARAVSGTSSQRFAASPVLIAEYGSSGAGTTWTLTRGTRSEVEGLPADNTGGLAIQVDEPGLGWVTRSLLPSRAGDFGIQSLVRPGRVVLLEPGTIEEVAVSPNGLELLDARHSRAGALAFDSGDTTSLSPELLEGDTLVLAYRDVESHSGRFAITLRGESGVRATRSNPPAPEPRWEFALRQNRPNPFGVTTTIGFTIPRASFVRLEILDTQGRRVRVLANRTFEPGAHELVWDRRTTSGAVVSPGVYYYRIRAGEFSARKKLVVL